MFINSLQATHTSHHSRDRLTGALSRLHFLELLQEEKRFADRNGSAFLLCLIDVDQLRNVNDQMGQKAGDEVLLGVANRLRDILDTPPWSGLNYLHARFDGDGLMVLLRCCRLDQGQRLAEALRSRVGSTPFSKQLDITVSIGVAAYRIGESTDEVLGRTERTLRLAKQSGRDCVEIALCPETTGLPDNVVYLSAVPRSSTY